MLIHDHVIQASNETMWGLHNRKCCFFLVASSRKKNLKACLLNDERLHSETETSICG